MKKVVWECDNCKVGVTAPMLPNDWVIVEVHGSKQEKIEFHWCPMCWNRIKGTPMVKPRRIKTATSVVPITERDEDEDLIIMDKDENDDEEI